MAIILTILLLFYTLAAIVGLLWLTRYLVDRLLTPPLESLPLASSIQQSLDQTDNLQQNPEPSVTETNHQSVLMIVSILCATGFIAFFIGLEMNAWRYQAMKDSSLVKKQHIETSANPITETTAKITQLAPALPSKGNDMEEGKMINHTAIEEAPSIPIPSDKSIDDAQTQLKQYIKQHYNTLYYQQTALNASIKQFQIFFDQIDSIAQRTPLHRRFLAEITKNRWQLQQQFRSLEKKIAADLLTFWAYYQVGSSTHTEKEFSKTAQRMTEQIQTLLKQEQTKMKGRNQLLIKDYAAYLLDVVQQPIEQKTFPIYSADNKAWLRQWLKQQNMEVIEAKLKSLDNQDVLIQQGIINIEHYQINYPDIASRLNKSLNLWKQAKSASEQIQFRIYHLVEASYLMANRKLDLDAATAQQLIGELIQRLPEISNEMNANLQAAQNAYQADITL